jgi:hypothetical protein
MLSINQSSKLIVLPTSRAIREHISSLKGTNQLLQKYITIADFFQRLAIDSKNRKQIDKNLKILYLKEAIKNCNIETLGFSRDFSTFLKQSDYIFRFFLETANEYVKFEKLLKYDTYTLYSDHIEILKQIYKNYTKILEQNNYTDNILMPESYTINKEYLLQFNSITIYLEGYLSSYEFNIVSDISKLINTEIIITINEYNQKNIQRFDKLKDELKINYKYQIDLSNNVVLNSSSLTQKKQDITISPISSQLEQIAFIKYQIMQMYQKGIDPSRIALIVPNEQVSSSLELFDDEHYFNFAMGRSIKNHKIIQVLKLINKILIDKEPKDDETFKFLGIRKEDFESKFANNWNKTCTKKIFNDIINYLFLFEEDEEVLEKLEESKITLEILLFTNINTDENVKVKELLKLLINQISSITIDDVNGGKVTVLGILETRSIEFDGIIVIDFNDDKIPKISVKDKFISTNIKQLASLPTSKDRENLQRYYYKKVFDGASSIAICYIDDESSVMSRFIVQLFTNYKKYLVKQDYKSILYQNVKLNHYKNDLILDINLSKKQWSATSLKSYLQCKRQYYYNYIAKIKEHTITLKPQNYEVGSIIHDALEAAVKNNSLNKEFVNNFFASYQKSNPYLVLELELWKKKLEKFYEFEQIRANNGIVIDEVEKPFSLQYNGITIKGKIDRIDKYPDGSYEILDYKTSSSLKIDTLKNYEESNDFQLEFYYLSQKDKMIKNVAYYTLSDCSIKGEVVLKEKLELLDMYFKTLHTKQVNFKMTDELSNCQFCTYKTICQRD